MGKSERDGGRKLPPYLFTFMQAINHNALCTASIDRFTVAMEIFINSSGIAEMALFCQQEEGGSLFFAFLFFLQAVHFVDAFGIDKRMCFFILLSLFTINKAEQCKALRAMSGEFRAKRVNSVHLNSFSTFYMIHFKMCTISSRSSNLFYVAALKACVLKVPKVWCICSCFVCGTVPFLN